MHSEVEQVGGTHYRAEYQHWDFVEDVGMGYLEGTATKYMTRWERKGGVEDLKKARSYVVKLMMILHHHQFRQNRKLPEQPCMVYFQRFIDSNQVKPTETAFCMLMMLWNDESMLKAALDIVDNMILHESVKQEF